MQIFLFIFWVQQHFTDGHASAIYGGKLSSFTPNFPATRIPGRRSLFPQKYYKILQRTTARRHWWIICVHSKHTKGLDKRRINIQAYRQKRQETGKESGREETQKRGNEKKPVTITKTKDKGQCFCGHNTAWRCFQIVLFVMFQLQSEKINQK